MSSTNVIINNETDVLKNKTYELIDNENKLKFLVELIDKKFIELDKEYIYKKLGTGCLMVIVEATAVAEISLPIICNFESDALLPMLGVLLIGGISSSIPIHAIKKSNKQIDLLGQTIPCLQEEYIVTKDKYNKLKKNAKTSENIDINKIKTYNENDLMYYYSEDKQKVKVKVR